MSGLRAAVALLTRVPLRADVSSAAVPWFPVVGALVGLAGGAVYAAGRGSLTALMAAVLAVGTTVVLTGAFHEDGLADVADSCGGWTRAERLRILHDPRLGTFGVAALTLTLLLRVTAVAALGPLDALRALVAAGSLGRGGAVVLLVALPVAAGSNLGTTYAAAVGRAHVVSAVAVALAVAALALGAWALAGAAAAGAATLAVGWHARRSLGGITGDVVGAAEQLAEVGVLLVAVGVSA